MNWHSVRPGYAFVIASAVMGFACGSESPAPSAVATPAPVATPTPAPTATPQAAFKCHLPALPDLHNHCPKLTPQLLAYVNDAVDTVQKKRPELFDFSDVRGESVRVLDRQKYQTAVVAAINAVGGVCAADNNEEIQVKVSNDFNEQFNIWTSAGYTRRSYITTCFPAQF
jgi:hypothetical protein